LKAALALGLLAFGIPSTSSAAEIDGCKYLIVSDLADDRFSLAKQLRTQGAANGFTVVSSQAEVPAGDEFKLCVIVGSWLGAVESGQVAIRVIDAASGTPIAAANVGGRNIWGLDKTLRDAVSKVFTQLQYGGYKEEVYLDRLRRLYPPRPTHAVPDAWVASSEPRPSIEGVWTDADKMYRLAIVPAGNDQPDAYLAVVLDSRSPIWQRNEIKAELTMNDPAAPIAATYYLMNKQPIATTFTRTADGTLEATLNTPVGPVPVVLTRESK
jgi:hypothetical protein